MFIPTKGIVSPLLHSSKYNHSLLPSLALAVSSFSQHFSLLAGTITRYNGTAESLVLGCSAGTPPVQGS